MLDLVKKRCGIAAGITVYDEEIQSLIDDCRDDLVMSGVDASLIEAKKSGVITAVTLYVKAYMGNDRTDTDKYLEQPMSDLRPTGVPVEIEGVERHLLFTLNAVDAIQEHFNMELGKVMNSLTDKKLSTETLRYVLKVLLNDEAERSGGEFKQYTDREIGWLLTLGNQLEIVILILKAYGISLPEAEEEEIDPNRMSGQTGR